MTQPRGAGKDLAEDRFGLAATINVSVVKGGDTAVQGRDDRGLSFGDLRWSVRPRIPRATEPHASVQQTILTKTRGCHDTPILPQGSSRRARPASDSAASY